MTDAPIQHNDQSCKVGPSCTRCKLIKAVTDGLGRIIDHAQKSGLEIILYTEREMKMEAMLRGVDRSSPTAWHDWLGRRDLLLMSEPGDGTISVRNSQKMDRQESESTVPKEPEGPKTLENSAAEPQTVEIPVKSVYTGDICDDCGSARMIRAGTCATCLDCGATGGCS